MEASENNSRRRNVVKGYIREILVLNIACCVININVIYTEDGDKQSQERMNIITSVRPIHKPS